MHKQSCFTSPWIDKQSCFTNPCIGSGSALVSCLDLKPRYESASVSGKFLSWTKDIVTAFSLSVSFLSVAASCCGSNRLDGRIIAESVLIIVLKQLLNGVSGLASLIHFVLVCFLYYNWLGEQIATVLAVALVQNKSLYLIGETIY